MVITLDESYPLSIYSCVPDSRNLERAKRLPSVGGADVRRTSKTSGNAHAVWHNVTTDYYCII